MCLITYFALSLFRQQGNQNSASVNDRSQLRTAPVTVRPSTRNSTTSPRSRPKTGNLRARTAPSVEVASAMEPTLVEHSVEDKIVHRLAITQEQVLLLVTLATVKRNPYYCEQILQLDISKQFKCFTTENGYRSPLCLNKLTNFAAPEKVEDERPQSRPARADTRVVHCDYPTYQRSIYVCMYVCKSFCSQWQ